MNCNLWNIISFLVFIKYNVQEFSDQIQLIIFFYHCYKPLISTKCLYTWRSFLIWFFFHQKFKPIVFFWIIKNKNSFLHHSFLMNTQFTQKIANIFNFLFRKMIFWSLLYFKWQINKYQASLISIKFERMSKKKMTISFVFFPLNGRSFLTYIVEYINLRK
jgi:hypothetical protein